MMLDIDEILTTKDCVWNNRECTNNIIDYVDFINLYRWSKRYFNTYSGKYHLIGLGEIVKNGDKRTLLFKLKEIKKDLRKINHVITHPVPKRMKLRKDIRLIKIRTIAEEFLNA